MLQSMGDAFLNRVNVGLASLSETETEEKKEEGAVGVNLLTRGCQFSYCFCRLAPIVSKAFCGLIDKGSRSKHTIQHKTININKSHKGANICFFTQTI